MKSKSFLLLVGLLLILIFIVFVSLADSYSCFMFPSIVLENDGGMDVAKIRICYEV